MNVSKQLSLLVAVAVFGFASARAEAQVAGAQVIGVTVEQDSIVVNGWSVKKSLLGKPVFNENGEKVGVLHDIMITPDNSVSFAIVAAHQFLGVSEHDVAIPIGQIDVVDGKLVWAGATREAVKATPPFQYAKVHTAPISRKDMPHH
ncbi:PRC-barrel domain-containing protein [Paraburkholderia sp. BCC1884]|uniref:PRC-barrel domain-containing protein n=1 Tax=Paraburkholderia sp. BCC1884 TaxID=2562668 RepID=UPI001183553B|nr:PRC-barrel domain-containing protein [Paraburkholderia sp. BCC1884]